MATEYMNLSLPVPGTTEGPEYATQNNTAFEAIDAHDHTPGKGTPVPTSGLNIDSDLEFGENKLLEVGAVNLVSHSAELEASNAQSVYSVNGDLYYNNSSGTPVQITQGDSVTSASSPLVPSGVIWPYGGSSAPTGFLMCDGSEVSQTTYSDLYAVIGSSFNIGSETAGNFRLPDMRGRVPMGAGSYTDSVSGALTRTLGQKVGAAAHTLTSTEMPSHTHSVSDPGHSHTSSALASTGGSGWPDGSGTAAFSSITNTATTGISISNTGGSSSHNNMQPSLGVNYIIKT